MAPRSLPSSFEQHEEKPIPLATKQHVIKILLILYIYGTGSALYGLYLCCTTAKWATVIMTFVFYVAAMIGVTAGVHRLWSHRSYKAKMPLQILLLVMYSLSFQNTVFIWVKDHRVHHKYSDTDADPHDSRRGFFYSQLGWLYMSKSDKVRQKCRDVDMRDIISNPVLKFQKRYAGPFMLFLVLLNIEIPAIFWGEYLSTAWHVIVLRFTLNLHMTSSINSFAHLWGNKPYDKNIQPVQNLLVSLFTFGEGFHNYHHTFPWDYKAGEWGNNKLNISTLFINFFAWIGWAYDLKSVPDDMVRARAGRTGDGTNLWGWGDKDMAEDMRTGAYISKRSL